jgi:hypothetical protein
MGESLWGFAMNERKWNYDLMSAAASRIVACRDFCGNENEEYEDFCSDNDLPKDAPHVRSEVFGLVERKWNLYRVA